MTLSQKARKRDGKLFYKKGTVKRRTETLFVFKKVFFGHATVSVLGVCRLHLDGVVHLLSCRSNGGGGGEAGGEKQRREGGRLQTWASRINALAQMRGGNRIKTLIVTCPYKNAWIFSCEMKALHV